NSTQASHAPYMISVLDDDGRFKAMEELENAAMHMAIEFHDGNITQAAKSLGIAKSTFYRKMDKAL
ncbi:MAG: helix-turn-helix domain-containing protein, partial [Pseudomonadota bacterium]|nr:helix-turn-helix domain-containing protein [Pseudomonadota bacterium]